MLPPRMNVLPVAAREARVTARRRELYWTRFTAAAVGVALSGFMLAVAREQPPAVQANALFAALSGFALVFAHFAALRTTADCLSEEKREGTLGLLFLTDLRAFDVIAGKVLASSANALVSLAALVPVLALPLLLGGVPAALVGKMALLLLNTLFFSLAAGVLVSALCRGAQPAMAWTLVLLLAVLAGPFLLMAVVAMTEASWLQRWLANLAVWQPPGSTCFDWLTVPSPMSGFLALMLGGLPGAGGVFGSYPATMVALQVLGWLFLGGALVALPRTWRDRAPGRPRRGRQAAAQSARAEAFPSRAAALQPLPFAWLVQRQRKAARTVWITLGCFAVLWGWGAYALESDWVAAGPALLWAGVLGLALKAQLAAAATAPLFEQRRSGALELVLCAGQTPGEIVAGHRLGLRRLFAGPLLATALAGLLLLLLAAYLDPDFRDDRGSILAAFGIWLGFLCFDAWTLAWAGMWEGLNGRHLSHATGQTAVKGILLGPSAYALGAAGLLLGVSLTGADLQEPDFWIIACSWVVVRALCNVLVFAAARDGLRRRFRELALEHYGPGAGDRAGWPFRRPGRWLAEALASRKAQAPSPQ